MNYNVFTIYGHDDHLNHVTRMIFTKFIFSPPKEAPYKFGFDWPSYLREN